MRLRVLGCGTSSGVPRIGADWGSCDPAEPRNRRTRASILIRTERTTILVDSGPDMRAQLLDARVGAIDAVIWTHEHADHTHGIDDLRQLFHARGLAVPGYARPDTLATLEARFAYVFAGRYGYPSTCSPHVLRDNMTIGDIQVRAVDMPHGEILTAGLRFEHGGRSIAYATDFNRIIPEMVDLFEGVEIFVADALRHKPHPTHPHLSMTLGLIADAGPKRAILTHMDQTMDYRALADELPDNVEPGYDGLEVVLS